MGVAQFGRASVCGTEGCRFKSYFPPSIKLKFFFLKKTKIQKKKFKKHTHLIKQLVLFKKKNVCKNIWQNLFFYKKYLKKEFYSFNKIIIKKPIFICLRQKKPNTKATISCKNTLNTFSIGSVMKYFKMQQSKYLRRSFKGRKIFFNFLVNIFIKKYNLKNNNTCILNVVGVDYNTTAIKNISIKFFQKILWAYTIYNIKISFTKLKNKKIKSIKKRLKKKLILNLNKNT